MVYIYSNNPEMSQVFKLVTWSVVLLRESLNALDMVRDYTPILVETCMDGMTQQKPYSK